MNYDGAGAYTAETVKAGDTVSMPASPSRSGYTFNGWFTSAEGGAVYDFTSAVNSDVMIYAQWSEEKKKSSHSHSYSEMVTKSTCVAEGYTTYTCRCGASYKGDTEPINLDNHDLEIVDNESGTYNDCKRKLCDYSEVLVDKWDGTVDTTWYDAENPTEYTLTTAEQFAGLGSLVDNGNTFDGKTIKLDIDIDLGKEDQNGNRVSFDPIGYGYDIVFKGTFDGDGHTIKNMYQNGWALGYDYSTEGGGLFASVVDATIKDLNIDNADIVMECIDMGVVVGYSYGSCTYENIEVTNSRIANYQRYTGGVVGEVNGVQTFKNVDVKDTTISSLWGDFDCSVGGIVGGKYGKATLTFEDCDVECEINAYNDVTSSYQWYAYRRAGMLIGNSEETTTVEGRTSATASYLSCTNCTVTYGDWANYHYCEFAGTSWPYVRVEGNEVGQCSPYSNPRYGHPTDANGNEVVDDNHVHNDGEDHNILLKFDQLFGGGQGVYGTATHPGVTVSYLQQ